MAIAIANTAGTISVAIVALPASARDTMAITELTGGVPVADGQQSVCRDGHHQARSATAARFAFDQFASRMPESFRSKLEAGRESIVETMLAEAGTELKIN